MLLELMDAHDVARACLVQRAHLYGYDNSYVVDVAVRNPKRFTSVGVFDAQDTATPDIVDRLVRDQNLGGARLCAVRPWELDTGWFNSPQAMKFWEMAAKHKLPVALIFFHYHLSYGLPALKVVADLFPDLPIIIDHVGTPHASHTEVAWGKERGYDMDAPGGPDYGLVGAMTPFEDQKNVSFKLTQINIERMRDADIPLSAFVRRLTDLYGPDKLIWGSDIGQSRGTYTEMTDGAREAAAELTDDEKAKFFYGNAAAIYGS
jgi:predicted TIM-barrel fold metal-dependent hydrolase